VIKVIVDITAKLIGAEGAKTPAGGRGRGDPAGALSAEEAPRTARGKRSAWSGNQQPSLTEPKIKKSCIKMQLYFMRLFK
jgi:hypothetical protein